MGSSRTVSLSLVALAACGAAPPPPPAVANKVAPRTEARSCDPDLRWLDDPHHVRFVEHTNGHFGWTLVVAEIARPRDDKRFEAVVTISFRAYPDRPVLTTGYSLALQLDDVRSLLAALRDSVLAPDAPNERMVVVTDSSTSVDWTLEIAGTSDRWVQLYADDAETQPARWNVRGCSLRPPISAMRPAEQAVERFFAKLGVGPALQKLRTGAP